MIIAILLASYGLMKSRVSDRNTAVRRLGVALFAVFAAISVIWPELVSRAAHVIGVGRGTDLVLYLLLVAFLASLVTASKRRSVLDRKITSLAREVALAAARVPDNATDESR
nr:DUF2304 domain-containing protein [Nanchangia anserum]